MSDNRRPRQIAGVVLAAGESSRMGRPKALLPVRGQPFVRHIRQALLDAGLSPVVVVLGHHADVIASEAALSDGEYVVNAAYREGMLTSLKAGIRAIQATDASALVLTLVDGPDISAHIVKQLAERFEATNAPIVEPTANGQHGHPVVIRRDIWSEILDANPAEGAKAVIRRHRSAEGQVAADASVLVDLDTPAEFAAWAARQ